MVVVICGYGDNGSVRRWALCVFFMKYMRGVDVLNEGCGGMFNALSTSSLMSSLSLSVCVSGGIVVGVSGLFLWVDGGFLCRVLCISVLSLSRLGMIFSFGLVFFAFSTKDSP